MGTTTCRLLGPAVMVCLGMSSLSWLAVPRGGGVAVPAAADHPRLHPIKPGHVEQGKVHQVAVIASPWEGNRDDVDADASGAIRKEAVHDDSLGAL